MAFTDLSWHRPPHFLISTSPSLLQPTAINAAFGSDFVYWTKPLPEDKLQLLLANSLCLGLYDASTPSDPKQIGFRRLVTDKLTFAYTTDYYVLPEYRGMGLGEWLQDCTRELIEEIEAGMDRSLRGFRVITATKLNPEWYEKKLGMKRIVQGEGGLVFVCRSGYQEA